MTKIPNFFLRFGKRAIAFCIRPFVKPPLPKKIGSGPQDQYRPAASAPVRQLEVPTSLERRTAFLRCDGEHLVSAQRVKDFLASIRQNGAYGEIYFNVPEHTGTTELFLYNSRYVWLKDGILCSKRVPSPYDRGKTIQDEVMRHNSVEEVIAQFSRSKSLIPHPLSDVRNAPVNYRASNLEIRAGRCPFGLSEALAQKKTVGFYYAFPDSGYYVRGTIWLEEGTYHAQVYQYHTGRDGGSPRPHLESKTLEGLISLLHW